MNGSACCCSGEGVHERQIPCPFCHCEGERVPFVTVWSLLKEEQKVGLRRKDFRVCTNPECKVVYYSEDGEVYTTEDIRVRVGFKVKEDPIPVCYCHGVTRKDIVNTWRSGRVLHFGELLEVLGIGGECLCEVKNPKGRCCVEDTKRILSEEFGVEQTFQASCCGPGCCNG
ncbi:MAG: putative iron-sulfur cluster-binding metallochaperone [Candidatus Caldatribacteriaceae bacterium]